jgi:beta-ureidopropionase / N-carbamoyl-L-amino-acid hydrolase
MDEAVVLAISDRFLARIEQEAGAIGVQISIAIDERRAAPMLDAAGADLVRGVAGDPGMKVLTLKTVRGHDALAIQNKIPSSLIFVPSKDGLSHNPRQYTAPEALRQLLAALHDVRLSQISPLIAAAIFAPADHRLLPALQGWLGIANAC